MSGCFGKLQVVNIWASHMDESLVIMLKFINEQKCVPLRFQS